MNHQDPDQKYLHLDQPQSQEQETMVQNQEAKYSQSCEGEQKQNATVQIESSLEKVMSSLQQEQLSRFTYSPTVINFTTNTRLAPQHRKNLLSDYKNHIWNYLCSKFISQEIIQTIMRDKVLDTQLNHIQFMYMLTFRGFWQMIYALQAFSKQGRSTLINGNSQVDFVFKPQEQGLMFLVDPMRKIYHKSKKYYYEYHAKLTQNQNYWNNSWTNFRDRVFNRNRRLNKDKFLCGFEGIDFTKQEQMSFMNSQYLNDITKQLQNNRYKNKYQTLIKKIKILKSLIQFNCPNFEKFDDFEYVKNKFINQCSQQQQKVQQNTQQNPQQKVQQNPDQKVQQKVQLNIQSQIEYKV